MFSIALINLTMHFEHFSKDLMSNHVWRQTQTKSTIINFYEEDMNILNLNNSFTRILTIFLLLILPLTTYLRMQFGPMGSELSTFSVVLIQCFFNRDLYLA